MFPCDIITIEDLTVRRSKRRQQQQPRQKHHPTSSRASHVTEKPIENTSGLKILQHLYDSLSILDTIHAPETTTSTDTLFQPANRQQQQPIQSKRQAMTFVEKTELLLSLRPRAENVPQITKSFLRRHAVTMETLCRIGVPVTDLWNAGIVRCYDDLLDLDFKLRDLTVEPTCFSVNHMYTLFKLTARDLNVTVVDLLECNFSPADLMNMAFSLATTIDEGGIHARHLAQLKYSPQDLRLLGVDASHLARLGINAKTAYSLMGWSPTQLNVFK